MAQVTVDTREVQEFAARLRGVPSELSRQAVPTLKRAAQNIKAAQQAELRGSSNKGFQKIAGAVSYDEPAPGAGGYETEIGINKEGAGKLGNIAVYGTPKGGGTHKHTEHFAREEMPNLEREIDKLVEGLF